MASMLDDLRRRYAASNQRYEDRTTMGGRGQLAGGMQDRTYRSGPEYLRGIQSLRNEASTRPQVRGMTPEAVRHRGLGTPREPIPVSSVAGAVEAAQKERPMWEGIRNVGEMMEARKQRNTRRQIASYIPQEPSGEASGFVDPRSRDKRSLNSLSRMTPDVVFPLSIPGHGEGAEGGLVMRGGDRTSSVMPASSSRPERALSRDVRFNEDPMMPMADGTPRAVNPVIPDGDGRRTVDPTGDVRFNEDPMMPMAGAGPVPLPERRPGDAERDAANARSARMAPPVLYEGENMEGMVIEGGVPLPAAAVTAAEAEPVQEPVDEKSFLDNEWVRLGLNMMVAASKPGATALGSLGEGAMATISDRDKRKAINAEYAFRRNMLEAEQKHSSTEKAKDRKQTARRITLLETQRQDAVDNWKKTHDLEGKKVYDAKLMSSARIKSLDDENTFAIEAAAYAKINDVNDRNLKMVELVSKRNNAERTSLSRIATALAPGMKTWMESAAVRDPAYIKASAEGKREMAGAFLNGLVDQVTGQVGSTQRIIAKEGSRDLLMGFIMSQNPNLFDFKKGNGGGGQDSPMPDTDPLNVR
jgi:hypothetical protein